MENNLVNRFKEIMRNSMIKNFENDGALSPVMFYIKDNQPIISQIPYGLFESQEGKYLIAETIKNICSQPNVLAVGIIIEAYGAVTNIDDKISKDIISGEIKISDLDDKQDIIAMVYSTPEKEEIIAYAVDEREKKVLDRFGETDGSSLSGLFSGFFNWSKN
jgi:hypothetical protein